MAVTLVLCAETDLEALWVWRELHARGVAPLELVTSGMIANALRWRHELGEGEPHFEITLADGRVLRSEEIRGVLNRLTHVPMNAVGAAPNERSYAEQEWNALLLSWLHALPGPTLNPPAPHGLSGAVRHVAEWRVLAARAGLPTVPTRLSFPPVNEMQFARCLSAIVVGAQVLGFPSQDEGWTSACLRLAQAAGCSLLGLDFARVSDGRLLFMEASTTPDLRRAGPPLIDALATALHA